LSKSFNADRLKLARLARGWKQGELAERVASSPSYISELERAKKEPGDLLVEALAEALGYSPEFFYKEEPVLFQRDSVNFRHRAATPEYLKDRIASRASLYGTLIQFLDSQLGLPSFDVPDIAATTKEEVEEAARYCRQYWGLGAEAPVDNMVRVAENAGVPTVEFEDVDKVDAFSAVSAETAVIFLNRMRPSASRRKWSIGHELGHLVVHRNVTTGDKATEDQANLFAGEFLMPAASFGPEFRAMPRRDLAHMLELKQRWKTSLQAIICRGRDLGYLSAVETRRLYKLLSARGWRRQEPHEPEEDIPEIIPSAIAALGEVLGWTLLDAANALGIDRENIELITGLEIALPRPDNVTSIHRFRASRQAN